MGIQPMASAQAGTGRDARPVPRGIRLRGRGCVPRPTRFPASHAMASPGLLLACLVLSLFLAPAPTVAQIPERPPSAPSDARSDSALLGTVVDAESGAPLVGADVVVFRAGGGVVARAVPGTDGRFRVEGLPPGAYRLEVIYLGRGTVTLSGLELEAGSGPLDVGRLEMGAHPIDLEGIQVETARPEVTFEADRNVYHVGEMAATAGGSLADALEGVPELELDVDGRLELEGNTPEIYLNGRPAPMDAESLAAFLEQFPAELIDRIEVIPNPSARFQAEGAGGIVNIVLQEGAELGVSGSVFANAGTRGTTGAGGRLAAQRGALTGNVGVNLRRTDQRSSAFDQRQNLVTDPGTFLEQDRESRDGPLTAAIDLRAEYQAGENVVVWTRARLDGTDGEAWTHTRIREWDEGDLPAPTAERRVENDRDRTSGALTLGFDYRIGGARDHELSGRIEGDRNRNDQLRTRSTYGLVGEWEDVFLDARELDRREQDRSNGGYGLDYARPLGGGLQVEVGVSGHHRDHDNARRVEAVLPATGSAAGAILPSEGAVATEGFFHGQRFHSGYLTTSGRRGDLALQAGLRVERTSTLFRLPDGEAFDSHYTRLFPSVNARWQANSATQLRFSYSQRIRRPGPGALNPIDQSADPYTREVGNPDLAPQFTHSYRVDLRWSGALGSLALSPTYQLTTDEWLDIRTVDALGVATESPENLGTTRRYGMSVTASLRERDGWRGSLTARGARESREGGPEALAMAWDRSLANWSLRGNLSKQINRDLSLQSRLNYRPGRAVPQGRVSGQVTTRVGARLRVMDRRGAVNLTLQNPLESATSRSETRDATHIQIGERTSSRRAAVVSFSYAFGGGGSGEGRRGR
jgi:outer membrane receptor protein involved in Fe transport